MRMYERNGDKRDIMETNKQMRDRVYERRNRQTSEIKSRREGQNVDETIITIISDVQKQE